MADLTKIVAAGLATTALGLIVAACQPPEMAPSARMAGVPVNAMTVPKVQELIVGNTVLVRDEGRKVSRVEYFAADGTVKLRAKPDAFGMTFSYDGTHYFNDQGEFCTHYPTIPVSQKEYCVYVVPLGDDRFELTDGGIYEQVLDGEQLNALK